MIRTQPSQDRKTDTVHVAFYIRVSGDKQARMEDSSLDTQIDRLQTKVRQKHEAGYTNWQVDERFVEGEKDGVRRGKSGKNADRPMYQQLLERVKGGLLDVVMVTRLDRISRNLGDFIRLVAMLEEHHVQLISLKEDLDFTTPAGRLFAHMLMALAQYERETVASRVSDKTAWRAEKGLPIGRPPIGYHSVDKKFVRHDPFAAHVKAAEAFYLERHSSDAVVKEFARLGYRTPGGAFYNKPAILRILRSEVYAAKINFKGKVSDAQWEPLRTWEEHQKIQALLDRNERTRHGGDRPAKDYAYLLQSILRCGLCGRKMTPRPGTGRSGSRFPYYACNGAERSVGVACPRRFVPARAVDSAVLAHLKGLALQPERIETVAKHANEQNSETMRRLTADLERVKAQLGTVMASLRNIVAAIKKGSDSPTMHETLRGLDSERAQLEETKSRLDQEIDAERTQEIVAHDVIGSLKEFRRLVEANEDHVDRLKVLLPRFVNYIVWHEEKKGVGQMEMSLYQKPLARLLPIAGSDGTDASSPRFAGEDHLMGGTGFEPVTLCV